MGKIETQSSKPIKYEYPSLDVGQDEDHVELLYWVWQYFGIVIVVWHGIHYGWWVF